MSVLEPDFLYNGMAVGYFEEVESPRLPGRYRYMPYRGPGHYDMQVCLQEGRLPRCYYESDGVRIWFSVRDCPEYGVLELCDFDTSLPEERKV